MATREIELSIEGMSCAACSVRIEKKLNKDQRRRRRGEVRDGDGPGHRAVREAGPDADHRDRGRHLSHCVTEAVAEGGDGAAEKVREASDAIARLVHS